jgi:hypothetical protein
MKNWKIGTRIAAGFAAVILIAIKVGAGLGKQHARRHFAGHRGGAGLRDRDAQ